MGYISTVLALLAAACAVWAARYAHDRAQLADRRAARLAASIGRITGLEAECSTLTHQLQKLRGSFFALKREMEHPESGSFRPEDPQMGGDSNALAFCENYGRAQIDGPGSLAAKCECEYCVEMRGRKAGFRRASVPTTVRAQGELAKLNASR